MSKTPIITNMSVNDIDMNLVDFNLQTVAYLEEQLNSVLMQKEIILFDKINNNKNIEGLTELYSDKIYIRSDFIRENSLSFVFLLLHELYHTMGLRHCINKKCIMSIHFRNGKKKYYWKSLKYLPNKPSDKLLCWNCKKLKCKQV